MTKYKLTPWFPADVKPVHVGVYKVQLLRQRDNKSMGTGFSYWNGNYWANMYGTFDFAIKYEHPGSQNKRWRGLKEQVK